MPQTHCTCLLYQHLVHGLQVLPSVSFPTPRMAEVAAELQAAPGQTAMLLDGDVVVGTGTLV